MKVCVLISTYNGEKYLEEQLQSVLDQKGVTTDILVRDDGSSDKTCEILDAWQKDGKLKWYAGQNLGFALSFMNLLEKADGYKYYAFCDQDDIWLPDKLLRAVTSLEGVSDKVRLYCSNVYYYKDGQTLGGIHHQAPKFDKYTCLLRNISPGCTMVFNDALRNILVSSQPVKIIAHDFWVFQVAMLMGTVYYDFSPTMLYRQHENNQIGQKDNKKDIWKRRLKDIFFSSRKHEREEQAKEIIKCYHADMREDDLAIVKKVSEYRTTLAAKFALMTDLRYSMGSKAGDFYLRFRILFSRL